LQSGRFGVLIRSVYVECNFITIATGEILSLICDGAIRLALT
jgi:hypothetical protein